MRALRTCLSLIGLILPLVSADRVDLRQTHERILCVVPMTGAGTWADPRRPLFAPARIQAATARDGIIGFTFITSDDGRFALVEFVARNRAAFRDILNDRRAEVKVFEKGRHKASDIEQEFRRFKKDFDLKSFGVSLP
jgi:hypothetical protein